MRSKTAILALIALALGLIAIGCGSSSSGEDSIDKVTFVKQAETICKKVSGRLIAETAVLAEKEGGRPGSSPAKTSVKLVTQIALPGFETELKEIRALGIPEESKQQVNAFLMAMESMIKAAAASPEHFATSGGPYEATELAGRRFGLAACPIAAAEAG